MTLNVIALFLRYFAEFGSFHGQLRKSGWLAINNFLPRNVLKYTNYKHDRRDVLFAVAEFVVDTDTLYHAVTLTFDPLTL